MYVFKGAFYSWNINLSAGDKIFTGDTVLGLPQKYCWHSLLQNVCSVISAYVVLVGLESSRLSVRC